ncbi:hypothetical protein ACSSNL_13330 [Thalassobius sp. S69A]|uniref:hypothetical protein n=1 Tax=unclassified Thalassovita TaxID=2619711 RepID=UPI003C7B060B
MSALYWLAYAAWALAAVSVLIGLTDGGFEFFVIAISIAISGVLFFAFGKVISLLSDIRDSLASPTDESEQTDHDSTLPMMPLYPGQPIVDEAAPRSIEEISTDLERLKRTHD